MSELPNPYRPPGHTQSGPNSDPMGWALACLPLLVALAMPFIPFRGMAVALAVALAAVIAFLVRRDAQDFGHGHPSWPTSMAAFPIALPIYVNTRRSWGASLKLPHVIVAIIAFWVGVYYQGQLIRLLVPPAKVTVSCRARSEIPKDGYICTTNHVGGYQDARACWDLALVCASGTRMVEHACAQAVVRESRDGIVPFEYAAGIDDCESISEAFVENLKVEIDP